MSFAASSNSEKGRMSSWMKQSLYSFFFFPPALSNPHKQQITSILLHLGRILSALYLFDGRVNGLVVFQLDKNGW